MSITRAYSQGTKRIEQTKTGETRPFAIEPNLAGVTRPELHEGSPTRKQLTWHDLRATGITWMATQGDDPLKIKKRAGHTTLSTTGRYIRQAEAVREGFGEVFPELPECLGFLARVRFRRRPSHETP